MIGSAIEVNWNAFLGIMKILICPKMRILAYVLTTFCILALSFSNSGLGYGKIYLHDLLCHLLEIGFNWIIWILIWHNCIMLYVLYWIIFLFRKKMTMVIWRIGWQTHRHYCFYFKKVLKLVAPEQQQARSHPSQLPCLEGWPWYFNFCVSMAFWRIFYFPRLLTILSLIV